MADKLEIKEAELKVAQKDLEDMEKEVALKTKELESNGDNKSIDLEVSTALAARYVPMLPTKQHSSASRVRNG